MKFEFYNENNDEKILIEIAAYLDPELLNTVNSAIIQADNPDRLYFSICYQNNDLEDYNKLKQIKNCRVIHLREEETKGACYARYLCQSQIEDEKYVLQIDSHMRFVKHWDTKMIECLHSLNDPKAIITFYPQNCNEEMMKLPLDDPAFDNPTAGGVMYTDGFGHENSYFLKNRCLPIDMNDHRHKKRNAFLSAGNFFTFSEAHKTVLHDPEMYFYGDELPMSIRLFTHGWNLYSYGECYVYHQYERKNQKFSPVKDAMPNELKRFKKLLKIDPNDKELGEFGLGSERTLKEYEEFAGIDFKNKIVTMKAELGEFDNEEFSNTISYIQHKENELNKKQNKKNNIEIIIVDIFDQYQECIDSCLYTSLFKENVKFIVGTTSKKKPKKNSNIKEIIYFEENKSYSEILSNLTQYLGNGYVCIVDSGVRFLKDWDKCLPDGLKKAGKNAVLTGWIWRGTKDTDYKDFIPYNTIIKDVKEFNDYLPILKFNEEIDMSSRKNLYHTAFISNGFIFTHSRIIKKIPFDPSLNYDEQQIIYSLRLWTNGFDIYYPVSSHAIRVEPEEKLNNGINNYAVISALFGKKNYHSKNLVYDYKYDIGDERPLWTFYEFINQDFDLYK